MKVAPRCRERT